MAEWSRFAGTSDPGKQPRIVGAAGHTAGS